MTNTIEARTETIVLGGGCFWCLEPAFINIKGVESVTAGYAGGHTINPTYEEVISNMTGHAEVVKIDFNNSEINLDNLLKVFFSLHDPTTLNRQDNDIGTQYRSIILITKPQQAFTAHHFLKEIQSHYQNPIVTELKPLKHFYAAEDYHQKYFLENKNAPYCQFVITPKFQKFKTDYKFLLK